jgi:hypothetical protein
VRVWANRQFEQAFLTLGEAQAALLQGPMLPELLLLR